MNVLLLKTWLAEEGPALIGARLRGVRQHDDRTLLIDLAAEDGPRVLLMSVLEEYPALAFVDDEQSLPAVAGASESSFAKALNYSLAGYRLVSISQEGFDRSVVFTFLSRDSYGEETVKVLRHELVGRAANAFLISGRGMVVSIMKRVRRGQNRVRHIITGKPLPDPPPLGKFIAVESSVDGLAEEIAALAAREGIEEPAGLEHFFTRRVATCDVKLWPALEPLLPVEYDLHTLLDFIRRLQDGALTAQLFGLKREHDVNLVALSKWCEARKRRGSKRRPTDIARERIAVRLDRLRHERRLGDRADEVEQLALDMLKQAGDIDPGGTAHAYIRQWREEHPDWAEQVSAERTIYDNAQELVHYAQRLRRGKDKLDRLIAKAEQELLRAERRPAAKKKADPLTRQHARLEKHGVKYLRFVSSDGLHVLCGVNDRSNDGLLRVFSSGRHLWLHARDYPGSHVIVLSDGRTAMPQRTIEEAALVAAYHSQGRKEGELEVSYLPVKHVRRVKGGKPGQVLKTSEKVVSVRPERFLVIKDKLQYKSV